MKDPVAEVREVSEVSDVHLEMPRHGLRSTQLTPSPDLLPLLEKLRRWWTPKRCCSSITA